MPLIATANGWTIEQAAAHLRAGDILDSVAAQLREARPGISVGGVLSRDPDGAPALYIKGPADEFVRALVAGAEIDIEIVDKQPFSFEELEERKQQVSRALQAWGFQYASVGFSVTGGGQIEAGVTRQAGLPDDPAEILSGLPEELRASVVLTVSDAPVVVDTRPCGEMQSRDDG